MRSDPSARGRLYNHAPRRFSLLASSVAMIHDRTRNPRRTLTLDTSPSSLAWALSREPHAPCPQGGPSAHPASARSSPDAPLTLIITAPQARICRKINRSRLRMPILCRAHTRAPCASIRPAHDHHPPITTSLTGVFSRRTNKLLDRCRRRHRRRPATRV